MTDRVVVVHYVMDPGGSSGRWEALSDGGFNLELPAGSMWNPVQLAGWFHKHFSGEGTLVTPEPWGDPEWVRACGDDGWFIHTGINDPNAAPWVVMRARDGRPTIHLCRSDLVMGDDRTPLLRPGMTAHAIAHTLGRWHEVSGAAFRGSPGTTGMNALRAMVRVRGKGGVLWNDGPVIDPSTGEPIRGMGDLHWVRPTDTWDTRRPWVHGYDLVAQYVAAATTTVLPYQALVYREPSCYDRELGGGFYRVRADDIPLIHVTTDVNVGVIDPRRIADDGTVWLSAPVMEYLSKGFGTHPEPCGAMLADRSGRLLVAWAQHMFRLRQGFAEDDPNLVVVAKRAANETFGMMGRTGGRCWRPDWRHLVIDQARVNLVRKIDAAVMSGTVAPVAVKTDAMWFSSSDPDPVSTAEKIGLRIGEGLGHVRVVGSKETSEWTGQMP